MKHYNPSISARLKRIFNLKGESTTEIFDEILPVIPILPRCNVVKNLISTNSTGGTIYTTPADKDFYLTGFILSLTKDAGATSTYSGINCVINGVTTILCRTSGITLTAQEKIVSYKLNEPLLIDRNTTITTQNQTANAVIVLSATIYGYTEETASDSNE